MMMTSNEILLALQLFAGGGAAQAGAGVSGSAAGNQGDSDSLSNAREGIDCGNHPEDAPADPAGADDHAGDFDALIKGRYKADYDRNVQQIVTRRVKGMQGTVDAYNKALPLIEAMARKYGIDDPGNMDAIRAAMDADSRMPGKEAGAQNLSAEKPAEMSGPERENETFGGEEREAQRNRLANAQVAQWEQQAAAARRVYPALDMQVELRSHRFADFLRSGLDVQTAYEIMHKDEILAAGMQYAARQAAEKVAQSVAAGAKRPSEGGSGAGVAAIHKTDPAALTRNDMKEIYRRVASGERVSFG